MDEVVEKVVIYLNICTVKLMARCRALELVKDNKERIRDDLEKFKRAQHHIDAAITFVQQTHYAPDEIDLELPFDWE